MGMATKIKCKLGMKNKKKKGGTLSNLSNKKKISRKECIIPHPKKLVSLGAVGGGAASIAKAVNDPKA